MAYQITDFKIRIPLHFLHQETFIGLTSIPFPYPPCMRITLYEIALWTCRV